MNPGGHNFTSRACPPALADPHTCAWQWHESPIDYAREAGHDALAGWLQSLRIHTATELPKDDSTTLPSPMGALHVQDTMRTPKADSNHAPAVGYSRLANLSANACGDADDGGVKYASPTCTPSQILHCRLKTIKPLGPREMRPYVSQPPPSSNVVCSIMRGESNVDDAEGAAMEWLSEAVAALDSKGFSELVPSEHRRSNGDKRYAKVP